MLMLTRRELAKLSLISLVSVDWNTPAAAGLASLGAALAEIETECGGRLGVAVLDTGSGALAGHRVEERFPMCSTFKALAAAAILARVDAGKEQLSRRVRVEQKDILSYAPVTKQHVGGDMSIAELCGWRAWAGRRRSRIMPARSATNSPGSTASSPI
jgi:beta-lactamase class A